jgi:uncharacterized protein with FMN-binding domain
MNIKKKLKKKPAYRDGEYKGRSIDAIYGHVQVKAIIKGGELTDVEFIDYPKDNVYSNDLNVQATVRLRQEAIRTQNSGIDIVSGATETSNGFINSLESALFKAKQNKK